MDGTNRTSKIVAPLLNAGATSELGRFNTRIAAIFVLSVAVQLLAGFALLFRSTVTSLDMDEQEYWHLANPILAGLPMDVGRRTVAFPLLIAGLRRIADNVVFVQSAIAVLSATAPPLLALVVRKLTRSDAAAVLAGIGFALWPVQIFYGSSLYSETIALPAFLLFLLILPLEHSSLSSSWFSWMLAGATLGITAHVRPMYQLFLPILPLILWLDIGRFTKAAGRFTLVVAGFAVVVLPWSVYVSNHLGHPTLLTANGGETFAGGFNPQLLKEGHRVMNLGSRTTWSGPGKWLPVERTGYLSTSEQTLPYAQQDQLLRKRALNWMISDPRDAAYLAVRKVTYMWGIYPFAANGIPQAFLGNVLTLVLLFLFIFAIMQDIRVRRYCARLYLLPLFVTGVALISWGSWRFRLPADAGLIGVVALWASTKLTPFRGMAPVSEFTSCAKP